MQNTLINIEKREIVPGETVETVNARELWQFVESRRQFANWINQRIDSYGFVEGSDFTINKFVNGNSTVIDYYISVDMAKQLAMVENNEKGRQVRRYFIECERLAKAKAAVPSESDLVRTLNDPASLRKLLLDNVEKVLALESTVAAQKPKVEAFNRISEFTDGSMCVTDAAKALQVKPKALFLWMQQNDWTYRRNGTSWIAYQPRLKQGYLEHKITTVKRNDETDKIVQQVRVTPKGLSYLSEVFSRPIMQLE